MLLILIIQSETHFLYIVHVKMYRTCRLVTGTDHGLLKEELSFKNVVE